MKAEEVKQHILLVALFVDPPGFNGQARLFSHLSLHSLLVSSIVVTYSRLKVEYVVVICCHFIANNIRTISAKYLIDETVLMLYDEYLFFYKHILR